MLLPTNTSRARDRWSMRSIRVQKKSRSACAFATTTLLLLSVHTAPAADVVHGKLVFATCAACHTERPDAIGPSLKGVAGGGAAPGEGERYSGPVRRAKIGLGDTNLPPCITSPH